MKENDNGEPTGAAQVDVIASSNFIHNGKYTISSYQYSDLLLSLIGIKEQHRYITSETYETALFSIRSIINLILLDESNIVREKSPLAPSKNAVSGRTALYFLITADDLMKHVPEKTKSDYDREQTKRAGLFDYLNNKISALGKQKALLEAELKELNPNDIDERIDTLLNQLHDTEAQIDAASAESKKLLQKGYELSAKLNESKYLTSRYNQLHSQYEADIKRANFIIEGSSAIENTENTACPFCGNNISDNPELKALYVESAIAERKRSMLLKNQLEDTSKSVNDSIERLEKELAEVTARNSEIRFNIYEALTPKAEMLKEKLDDYKRLLELQRKKYSVEQQIKDARNDLFQNQIDDQTDYPTFDSKIIFGNGVFDKLSTLFDSTLKECAYPSDEPAYININSLDAVIGKKSKKTQGKGFRAFINTVMLFSVMKYLNANAKYAPHLLVLDSPILTLLEKKLSDEEKSSASMRSGLFSKLISDCGENQIIIAENDIPRNVDYSNANMIEFTMDQSHGRYGFLRDLQNK